MAKPSEHKTVQARIIDYAKAEGWNYVPRATAEARRGLENADSDDAGAAGGSMYFDSLLNSQVRLFNPDYKDADGALLGELIRLEKDISGNRELLNYLRNTKTYYDPEQARELNLVLVDYDDIYRSSTQRTNVYEITEEWVVSNSGHTIREDVVFLVNGLPVLVVECKNATKNEAIALGVDQIRRYHDEAPEIMVPQMLFTVTEAIGFTYGATWSVSRRNLFSWKSEELGNLEAKVRTFCAIPQLLSFLRDFIFFAEKDEALQKIVLRQHQTRAITQVVARALDESKHRGLIWHSQGSGKTYTMIKAAELLMRANDASKPTVVIMLDRNELEDQMVRNLASLGLANVVHADRIDTLRRLLNAQRDDYRGIIVTMIHKVRDMAESLNTRSNIFVLVDEAHRTTGGDLGNFLLAGLPNATFIGFTGTPVDKSTYGKGTFKTFGVDDDEGYLDKYSIRESIEDKTTLPLYYNMAASEMLVPHELMESEFFALAETEGIADIGELNSILDRAVDLKNFLKGDDRVRKVARYVATHYQENVEPLGYKAFLVGVDREACALYKEALDEFLPSSYSAVVYTGNNNDSSALKKWHIDPREEKEIRRDFAKAGTEPKILLVTEKLLTGYDAPILYAMYLDKPMRDHTLLQAIARVNRPYEDEQAELVKPHGFVLDFIGIFGNLEKALAFDSAEVNAIVKNLDVLKNLFKEKMGDTVPGYLALVSEQFDDRDVDELIEHFRDEERRKSFFKDYKELEMLYEIISPDTFMRPFIEPYSALSAIYEVVRNAFSKRVYVDRAFQAKTDSLVRAHIEAYSPAK